VLLIECAAPGRIYLAIWRKGASTLVLGPGGAR